MSTYCLLKIALFSEKSIKNRAKSRKKGGKLNSSRITQEVDIKARGRKCFHQLCNGNLIERMRHFRP